VKTPEQEAAIRSIRKLIDFWQIELEELIVEGAQAVRPAPVVEVALKYRHPVSGETWNGQGGQPVWLTLFRMTLTEGPSNRCFTSCNCV